MPQLNSDRNLLFGILALQMDFVNRDALIKGMHGWVLNKANTLGQILVEQKALGPEHHSLLEALVQAHLNQHGNNAEQSLAAVSSVGSLRHELQQIADPELQVSLAHASRAHQAEERPGGTILGSVGIPSSSGQRFRILRPHARGGLGQVSVAFDEELHREVALKEIQDQHADQESRVRFVREAEVTGGLEHPGIVPVYGLGCYADGRPFYAMRFIRGDSLKESITRFHQDNDRRCDPGERNLHLRELLRRFLDICNAISYAHSRGVLHRDLKPGNIMLGPFGETLVVDWGLAKPVDLPELTAAHEGRLMPSSGSGSPPTQMGSAIGTPEYMSPEQAAGRLDQLGPATDVYSLGATLYCLLTGQSAFANTDAGNMLARVQSGFFPAPRQVNKSVPPPLEAVCLKAMALHPNYRYSSVGALADDIEHWLADEPVSAYREPRLTRLRRWCRRHRTLVTAAAAAVLVATASLLVATLLLSAANRREFEAKRNAEKQRDQAAANFSLARQAVDRYCTKVSANRLLNEREMEGLRKELLLTAVDFCERLVTQASNDPGLINERGWAYMRLAEITAETGSKQEGVALYQRALASFRELADNTPLDPVHQADVAGCQRHLGWLYYQLGKMADAEALYREARDALQPLVVEHPAESGYQDQLAACEFSVGRLYSETGRHPLADQAYQHALQLRQELARREPDNANYQYELAKTGKELGDLYTDMGRLKDAEFLYCQARDLLTEKVRSLPRDVRFQLALSAAHGELGALYRRTARPKEAEDALQEAIRSQSKAAREHPTIAQYQLGLAAEHESLGTLYRDTGQTAKGEKAYLAASEIMALLVQEHADVPDYRAHLSTLSMNLGSLYRDTGQAAPAEELYRKSISLLEKLAKEQPSVAMYRDDLAKGFNNLGVLFFNSCRKTQPHKAEDAWQRARDIWIELAREQPQTPELLRELANIHSNLGALHNQTRHFDAAESALREAVVLSKRLVERQPTVTDYQLVLTDSYSNLGALYADLARYSQAKENHLLGLASAERIRKLDPALTDALVAVGCAEGNLGHLEKDLGTPRLGLDWYARSIQTLTEALKKEKENANAREFLRNSYSGRASIFSRMERYAESLADHDSALAIADETSRQQLVIGRAVTRAAQGEHGESAKTAQAMADSKSADDEVLVEAAGVFAISSSVVLRDPKLSAAERAQRAEHYASQAVALLARVQAHGLFQIPRAAVYLKEAPEFKSVRSRPDFKKLLEQTRPPSQ